MGYIARNLNTNKVYYSKGADKIAKKVGISGTTITRFFSKSENKDKDKTFKEWVITFVEEIISQNRGKNIKRSV